MQMWMAAALLSAVFYGINNIFIKTASGRISDTLSALCIQSVSLAVIVAYLGYAKWFRGEALQWSWPGVLSAAASGLLMGLGLIFLLSAFRFGGPISLAIAILLSGQIVIAVAAGWLFFREGLSPLRLLGLGFCFLGIWLSSTR